MTADQTGSHVPGSPKDILKPVVLSSDVSKRHLTGVARPAVAAWITWQKEAGSLRLILCEDFKRLETLSADIDALRNLAGNDAQPCNLFPYIADLESDDPRAFELSCDRLAVLTGLNGGEITTLLTTPEGLLAPVPPPWSLAKAEIQLVTGQETDFQQLQTQLAVQLGYDSEALCETPGQFAVRGGLIDIYPLNAGAPVRVDFFGDEIESIREFDPTTQRSGDKLERVVIVTGNNPSANATATLLDYLPESVDWIVEEPAALETALPAYFNIPENIAAPSANFAHVLKARAGHRDHWTALSQLDEPTKLFQEAKSEPTESESLEAYQTFSEDDRMGIERQAAETASRTAFLKQLQRWHNDGHQIILLTQNEAEGKRLQEILAEDLQLKDFRPEISEGLLSAGFRLVADGKRQVIATADEIFGRRRVRLKGRRRKLPEHAAVDQALDFSELADGDYLVHLQNGICIFRGLQKMDLDGRTGEVISLEFAEGVTVHMRLHESHLLSRYVGLSKVTPKLGKIGSNSWDKTRAAAERATLDFAAELLRLQAERETAPGHAFAPDGEWMQQFENAFPFEETRDQQLAIDTTKADMEKPHPMDRLICGDVGFGKTEVAIRAAFKAVLDGRQVAVLIPTTVLCQQHFNTFKERMAEHPIVVEMLSRFRTARQIRQIKHQLKSGQIDILVGTHALLGRGVEFANLGLLIIDEEHRFGVRQKEKIKQLRRNIDVLTMSATPIPRTLHSALVGVRQMSVIETAPRDRLPIQTHVKAYDLELVRDAICYELNRGGQVFYLHNRVQTIESVARRIQELVPHARLAVGHGQMEENDLEKIMTDFVAGQYDVLVCTTIIESGLDIPNCNTIIIEGADRFGLSQLYQLRGRVGRFNRQAYCYLLLHRHTGLMDIARKRLGAIRQYNQLGAGFRIAMRDLELRGAGNILGAQQSGHIAGVGFELYCQLLRQSVSRLKGDPKAAAIRCTVRLDFVVLGEHRREMQDTPSVDSGYDALKNDELKRERMQRIEAALPAQYLSEARLRIDFYRRLAMTTQTGEIDEIAEAMADRFGKRPQAVEALLLLTRIRVLAERKGIDLVETEGYRLKCRLAGSRPAKFIQNGGRFPRLTARKPIPSLREIGTFLSRLN